MQEDYGIFLKNWMATIQNYPFIQSKDIPGIDLYMDQVTTFMDEHLTLLKRHEDNKILTKTMINNYSKAGILPPSAKKKYSKDHMILLMMIYYMKHTLSLPDIEAFLKSLTPITTDEKIPNLDGFFDDMHQLLLDQLPPMEKQVEDLMDAANKLYEDQGQGPDLAMMSTVFVLSFQAAIQKHLATALIDAYLTPKTDPAKDKDSPKEKDKHKKAVEG